MISKDDLVEDLEFRLSMAASEVDALMTDLFRLRKQLKLAEEHLPLEARITYDLEREREGLK